MADKNTIALPKKKLRSVIIILIILILITGAVVALLTGSRQIDMTEDALIASFDYELSSKADFYTYGSNIYYANKDKLELVNEKGVSLWSDSYTMISPVLTGDKNIVAVSEEKGNSVRMYNDKGYLYDVSFAESLLTCGINSSGYMGAVYKSGSDYKLAIYNGTGQLVFEGSYPADEGSPTCLDISDDGRMFSIGFIDAGGIGIKYNILFYYINRNEVQSVENSNGMFASVVGDDSIPVMLRFTSDNHCIAVTDNSALFINPTASEESRTTEISLGNRLRAVCINGDDTLTMAMGEQILNAENQMAENSVVWYDAGGNKIGEYLPEREITNLFPGENITVLAMDRTFEAYSTKGQHIWSYSAIQDTTKVLPYNGNSKMLVVTPMRGMLAEVGKGNSLVEIETNTEAETSQNEPITEDTSLEAASEGETNPEAATEESATEENAAQEPTTEEITEGETEASTENEEQGETEE